MTYTVQYKFEFMTKKDAWINGATFNNYSEAMQELRHIKKQVNTKGSKHRIVDQNGKRIK